MISLTLKRNYQNQSEKILMKNQLLHMFMCVCVCLCVCVCVCVCLFASFTSFHIPLYGGVGHRIYALNLKWTNLILQVEWPSNHLCSV